MPTLLPDELISSWLVRAAMRFGCDPKALTQQIWPTWRFWTTDPDRGFDAERLAALVEASGISVSTLQSASLRGMAEQVSSQPRPNKMAWAWILTLGTRGNSRQGGLQYCPRCLGEDQTPYYRLQWRFAWHVGCEEHACALHDRCWHCDAPLEPHRLEPVDGGLAVCRRCKADLRAAPADRVTEDAMAFQHLADQVLHSGHGVAFDEVVGVQEWFDTAHFITALIRNAYHSMGHNALSDLMIEVSGKNPQDLPIPPRSSIEGLTNRDRQSVLAILYRLMTITRDEFVHALRQNNVRRRTLSPKSPPAPRLIADLASQLPDTQRRGKPTKNPRPPGPRPRHEVVLMMNMLIRKLEREQR
jgi:hypothetical protein